MDLMTPGHEADAHPSASSSHREMRRERELALLLAAIWIFW
jgi:hypothetical protein